MSTLEDKYYRQLKHNYDWPDIVQSANNNPQETMDGGMQGYYYLGSLINPSGKHYSPFAYSNVDRCVLCNGSGVSKKTDPCDICSGTGIRHISEMIKYGWNEEEFKAKFSSDFIDNDHFACHGCFGTGKVHRTCNRCGGLGSHDAYQDQEFWCALDKIAEEHNGWIESGESDPCDTFFCVSIETEDENE